MALDHETTPRITVCIDNNKKLIKQLEKKNIEVSGEKEHKEHPQLWFDESFGSIDSSEYYFDEEECALNFSGDIKTVEGDVYVSFEIPISDTILIDILQHSIKKLNKLKTAMETLK